MSSIKFFASVLCCCLLALFGCSQQETTVKPLRVGVIAGPEADLMKTAQSVAQKQYGLNIQVVTFSDYAIPNTALAEGAIDANMFQHQPYLDIANENQNLNLASVGKTYIYPMGIYSERRDSLVNIPKHAKVGIPSDPSNQSRALRLIAKAKLIKIPHDISDQDLTPQKVLENPFYLRFKPMNAAQLPRALGDLDYAVINTNYAMNAGLTPTEDALLLEDKDTPYANILVARTADRERREIQQLLAALRSQEAQAHVNTLFQGQAFPAWSLY